MDYPPASASEGGAGGEAGGGPDSEARGGPGTEAIDRAFPRGGGVYLLTDAEDRLVQLASAGGLRRALRGRLLEPVPDEEGRVSGFKRRRGRLGEVVRKIRWRSAHSMFEINYEYWRIARVLMPDAYLENLAFGPAWFVHVDPSAEIPHFVVGKTLAPLPGVDLGPFAAQADANRFVRLLEDAFDLCRHHQILGQTPHGQPCAYFEMGRCPAPCDGSIPMSQYRRMISSALAFASGRRKEIYENWQRQMREAAAELSYEKAAMFRHRLKRARGIERPAFRHLRPISEFNYLIIQRGGGRSQVKPFLVRGGWISPGATVKLKQIDQSASEWIAQMQKNGCPADTTDQRSVSADASGGEGAGSRADRRRELSEQIWLVSHHLFKRDAPGLFIHLTELGEPAELAERVRARFAAKPREMPGHGPASGL